MFLSKILQTNDVVLNLDVPTVDGNENFDSKFIEVQARHNDVTVFGY